MAGALSNQVVGIRGGGRGFGLATARAFARDGAQTVLASSSAANLAAAAKAVSAVGGAEAFLIEADLRTLAGCESVFAKVRDRFNRCDVLVNCAGATMAGSFVELPDAAWIDGF